MEQDLKLKWSRHRFDGYNYYWKIPELQIEIAFELAYGGYNVALYNLEGLLIYPRVNTDIKEDNPRLLKHFALNAALHIANKLYKDYYISTYGEPRKTKTL